MARATAAAAAAVCLLLAGCTAGEQARGPRSTATAPPGAASPTPTPTDTSTEADATPDADELGLGTEAAVLDVAIPEPSTLDPMLLGDPASVLVARQLFESLTRWNPERRRVVGAAARSWDVEANGRRFVFHLRPNMRFHDGSPVRSQDFRYAFDRIAQSRNASDLAYTLERIAGFDAVNRLGGARRLRGLSTPDADTLVIELSEPFHELPALLTHPGLVPLERERVEELDAFLREPVGNGPFRIAEPWQPGDTVVLEAFDSAPQHPRLDGIRFVPFADAAESWIPFDDGDLDVAEVPVGQVQTAADAYGTRGYQHFLTGYYFAFNTDRRPLRNARVRKAVFLAIDRRRIAERVYKGSMEPLDGIVPPGMPGFEGNLCADPCRPDRDAARALVRRLPKSDRRIPLEYTSGRPHARVAASVARDLRRVGFKVEISPYGFGRYLRRLSSGRHAFYRLGWIAEYPSPDVFLGSLFRSTSPDNHTGLASRNVDRLLARAHREPDEERRILLYRRAERRILAARVVVPIGAFVNRWAARPEVKNIAFDVMGGFDAATVALPPED